MSPRVCLVVLVVGFAASVTLLSGSATATPAYSGALLTFSTRYGLCVSRPDGSHMIRAFPKGRNPGSGPSWSPNGRYLTLSKSSPDPNSKSGYDVRLHVVTASGRFVRTLVETDILTGDAWSPDGHYIAIGTAALGGQIFIIAPNGKDARGVIASTSSAFDSPAWSPDSQRLAYEGVLPPSGADGIASIAIDGSDLRPLIPGGQAPAYSPDGTRLAYQMHGDIYVANASDGSGAHALTATPGVIERWPAWSPDGKLIAFTRSPRGGNNRTGFSIATIRPDGSGERVVIPSRFNANGASWRSPLARPITNRPPCR